VPNLVKISQTKDKFIFSVESTGQLKVAEIVKKSFDVLRQKLATVKDELEK